MVFNDRDKGRYPTAFDNDAMFGLRLAFNDAAGTEILFGYIDDIKESSKMFSLESSRGLGENVKLTIEGVIFNNIWESDPARSLAEDDYLKMEIIFYF